MATKNIVIAGREPMVANLRLEQAAEALNDLPRWAEARKAA